MEGRQLPQSETYELCRCGKSQKDLIIQNIENQPLREPASVRQEDWLPVIKQGKHLNPNMNLL